MHLFHNHKTPISMLATLAVLGLLTAMGCATEPDDTDLEVQVIGLQGADPAATEGADERRSESPAAQALSTTVTADLWRRIVSTDCPFWHKAPVEDGQPHKVVVQRNERALAWRTRLLPELFGWDEDGAYTLAGKLIYNDRKLGMQLISKVEGHAETHEGLVEGEYVEELRSRDGSFGCRMQVHYEIDLSAAR